MKGFSFFHFFLFLIFLASSTGGSRAGDGGELQAQSEDGIYIVYMGAATTPNGSPRLDHLHLLNYVSSRRKNAVVHNYKNGFSGFAARLSKAEVHFITEQPGVVSVFPDPLLQLYTTRSWDFLNLNNEGVPKTNFNFGPSSTKSETLGSDTIIGILDTGIWPESQSFNDEGMNSIPSRWKGICMKGTRFSSSNCNKKLIGARYYDHEDEATPRDFMGHGTHVASTAAGRMVPNVSYYGLGMGTAKGGSPMSRIAVYKVCSSGGGCTGSSILAAFDDAIADGVDVLSLSLGASAFQNFPLSDDPIAIGAFHAVEKGITVVCASGNDGPAAQSVVNDAPWIFTVAATTIDRGFETDVELGGQQVFKGEGIHFAKINKNILYPLVYAKSAKGKSSNEDEARNCNMDSLDGKKIKGKIVLCDNDDTTYSVKEKLNEVKGHGAIGLVLAYDQPLQTYTLLSNSFPMTTVTSKDAAKILSYITSTRNPVAKILPTTTVIKYKPAPAIPDFSSRGPSSTITNLLKPDIAAPGVNILAAWIGNDTSKAPRGKYPPPFSMDSGTSMSCPHVSGIAATIKSQHPIWTPSAIRSAVMTTATQTNNLRAQITNHLGMVATPYDYGAGEVSPVGSLQPGLVFETNTMDYLQFLCYYGYDLSKIELIASNLPNGFACPTNSNTDLISNINYPSIAIFKFGGEKSKTVSRTVTNVGEDDETIYIAKVEASATLNVELLPNKLQFRKSEKKLSYQVTFSSSKSSSFKGEVFGSITWSNGKYKVRSPFIVSA